MSTPPKKGTEGFIFASFEGERERFGRLVEEVGQNALFLAGGGDLEVDIIVKNPIDGFRYWHMKIGLTSIGQHDEPLESDLQGDDG